MVRTMHDWTYEPRTSGGKTAGYVFLYEGFNPHASSNRLTSPSVCYCKHEREKRRKYEERVREVEHGSFTSLVLSATGGMGTSAVIFYK